jgi:hypothetical protein
VARTAGDGTIGVGTGTIGVGNVGAEIYVSCVAGEMHASTGSHDASGVCKGTRTFFLKSSMSYAESNIERCCSF